MGFFGALGKVGGAALGTVVGGPFGGAVGGALGGGLGDMLGGGSKTTATGLTLPPEYELQYFQQFQQQMQQMQQSYMQSQQLSNIYNQRMNSAYGAMQGTIPTTEASKLLTQTSSQVAQMLGMSAEEMVKNGFIAESDQASLQKMQDIATQGTNYRGDSVTEQNISDQRRQLQQDLARQGIPAAQQMIAMQQFDAASGAQRQQAAQAQIGNLGGYLQTSSGLREQGFGQAVGGLNAMQGQLGFTQQGLSGLSSLAGNQYGNNLQGMQFQQGLRQEQQGAFTTMGQFKFSDYAKKGLESGLFGPGSTYNQTGVSRQEMGGYFDKARSQDNVNTTGQPNDGYKPGYQMTPEQYQRMRAGQGYAAQSAGGTGVAVNRFQQQPGAIPTERYPNGEPKGGFGY